MFAYFQKLLRWHVSYRIIYTLRGEVFERRQRVSLVFRGRARTGEAMGRVTGDTNSPKRLAVGLRIAFYSSHVPASAPEPSGDRTQARSLIAALEEQGHQVRVMSEFRAKFFWLRWGKLRKLPLTVVRAWAHTRAFRPDVWLTLGSERDVPDVLGPFIAGLARIP